MSKVEIDERDLPLVRVSFRGTPSDTEVARGLAELTECLARVVPGEPIAALIDTTQWSSPGVAAQSAMARWFGAQQAQIARYCAAVALVFPSSLTRAVVQGLLATRTPPCPLQLFGDRARAERWARQMIATPRAAG